MNADALSAEFVEEIMKDRIGLIKNNFELLKIVIYEINFHEEVKQVFIEEFQSNLKSVGFDISHLMAQKMGCESLDLSLILRTVLGQLAGLFIQIHVLSDLDEESGQEKMDELIKVSAKL